MDEITTLEVTNLHYHVSQYILPRLKKFKESTYSYPSSITSKEWDSILDKMIYSFEYAIEDNIVQTNSEEYKKYQEGMELFSIYYLDLWI